MEQDIQVPQIVTWHSEDGPAQYAWRARFLVDGRLLPLEFNASEAEGRDTIIAKAERWWRTNKKPTPPGDRPSVLATASVAAVSDTEATVAAGRGAQFIGSQWVANAQGLRQRVPADQVESYLQKGYKRGRNYRA